MIWLVLICCALVAVWGTSETWDLPALGRRLVRVAHGLRHHAAAPPVDLGEH